MAGLVDMEMDDEASYDAPMPIAMPDKPTYPYGLCINLTADELDKLGLDDSDVEVGDYLHIEALSCVTSVSKSDGPMGPCVRIELQIEKMGVIGSDGSDAASPAPSERRARLYKS